MHHPFLDHPGPLAIAHRGGVVMDPPRRPSEPAAVGSAGATAAAEAVADGDARVAMAMENTLPAFQTAVELGYRYLETDVRATADGALVAFHDEQLERVTDRRGRVSELPADEVARARVAGREPIPRLEELLTSFPTVRWNLDAKAHAVVEPLIDRLRSDPGLCERTCVGSFSHGRLRRVREALGRRICTSASPVEIRRLRLWSLHRLGEPGIEADCAQLPTRYRGVPLTDPVLLGAARRLGLPVHVWTVNDEPTMHGLLDAGVDGIITDATRTLRAVLRERGRWPGPPSPPR